ncbi:MAG: hypothetical protein C7B46_09920 [Sulfobacillus benefaciens]|uniref:ATP-binding protein n=1 Tax=Sulfobacillus benefaciens TaxID=453960 RepID=A0A2T2XFT3_9FIRM|nr:MAG: hypothetical protein C7B46_09920 [Sulfobacillus benefaciens]
MIKTNRPEWEGFSMHPTAESLSARAIHETFVDVGGLEKFWVQWYLNRFVSRGYGKVKFVVGKPGAGKTHWLKHFSQTAGFNHYLALGIDARKDRLSSIDEVYRAVASQLLWRDLIEGAALQVIHQQLGYPEFTGRGWDFLKWAESERRLEPSLARRDIREAVDGWLHGLDLDSHFMLVVRGWLNQLLSGDSGEPIDHLAWLNGGKIGAATRRSMGLIGNISQRNARAILASTAIFIHAVGYGGLVIAIDNIEVLTANARVENIPYYTRGKREQAYEMMRQLIDEGPRMPFVFLVLAGDSARLGEAKRGFPSYPALWARIQNEVVTTRVNRFSDWIDLDRLWDQDHEQLALLASLWEKGPADLALISTTPNMGDEVGLESGVTRRVVASSLTKMIRNQSESEEYNL